ncbi:MAG: hypothetical protein IPL83_08750 [Bdellovibrionales bacterium]|nr:hypothetical protein [Bdellovibrionales bacterium]
MIKLNLDRRSFLSALGLASLPIFASSVARAKSSVAASALGLTENTLSNYETRASSGYLPVVTPGISTLPYEMDGNTKVFRLTAQPVTTFFQDTSDPHGMKKAPHQRLGI